MKKLTVLMIVVTISVLFFPMIEGKTVTLNPTEEQDGVNQLVFKIGEIKYKYRIEVEFTNNHDYCNVTGGLGWYYTFPYNAIASITDRYIHPGERANIIWTNNATGKVDNVGIEITAFLNTSAYNDQQTNVFVTYTVKVFDDRGNLVIDSEDPNLSGDTGDEVEEETCCGSVIIVPLILLIGLKLLFVFLRNRQR